MKRVCLIVDCFDWAFHRIALNLQKHLGERYEIEIVRTPNRRAPPPDLAVWFWWKTAIRYPQYAAKNIVALYDHWSTSREDSGFQYAAVMSDVLLAGNEELRARLQYVTRKPIVLCEDGVDTEQFSPRPFPPEFTAGWAGNRRYEQNGLGDFKGVRLIEEACRLAGVPFILAEKTASFIPHAEMCDRFYGRISVYVCASVAEGTPNPVLESLACGRPVITTPVGITAKVVRAGQTGEFVDRRTLSLAGALAMVRARGPEHYAAAARAAALDWDWRLKAPAFERAFEEALDGT